MILLWLGVISLNVKVRVSLTQEKPLVAVLPFDAAKVSDTQVFDKSSVDAFAG